MLKRLKKGFTLAELLIVVAIIAVLTAIAVPLFVGALKDADKSVIAANERAVRGEAVEKILMDENTTGGLLYKNEQKETYIGWTVKAIVSASGEISAMEITPSDKAVTLTETSKKVTAETGETVNGTQSKKGEYYIVIAINDITPAVGS